MKVTVQSHILSIGMDFKLETIKQAVARMKDEHVKFCSYEMDGLDPGYLYRFRLTGINEQLNDCQFTGSIDGTLLSVSKVTYGRLKVGQTLTGEGISNGIKIKNMGSVVTGTGGVGTYLLSQMQEPIEKGIVMKGRYRGKIMCEFAHLSN